MIMILWLFEGFKKGGGGTRSESFGVINDNKNI